MACAAITRNRSALFLFVKIHIFSFGRCTHRGMGHEPLVKVSWPLSVAPALDKVCLACWPRAQGWLCVGIGLWNQRWLRAAVFRHWPFAVWSAMFRAAGRVSVLALGRVSVWVRQCVALACGRAWPGQTCVLAKNKAPNFRSLHETKELVSTVCAAMNF